MEQRGKQVFRQAMERGGGLGGEGRQEGYGLMSGKQWQGKGGKAGLGEPGGLWADDWQSNGKERGRWEGQGGCGLMTGKQWSGGRWGGGGGGRGGGVDGQPKFANLI